MNQLDNGQLHTLTCTCFLKQFFHFPLLLYWEEDVRCYSKHKDRAMDSGHAFLQR